MVIEDVEAGQFVQLDAIVEDRIWLAREHFDVVSQIGERFREVTCVDALPAHVGLSSIGEVGDAEGTVRVVRLTHRSVRLTVGHLIDSGLD